MYIQDAADHLSGAVTAVEGAVATYKVSFRIAVLISGGPNLHLFGAVPM